MTWEIRSAAYDPHLRYAKLGALIPNDDGQDVMISIVGLTNITAGTTEEEQQRQIRREAVAALRSLADALDS